MGDDVPGCGQGTGVTGLGCATATAAPPLTTASNTTMSSHRERRRRTPRRPSGALVRMGRGTRGLWHAGRASAGGAEVVADIAYAPTMPLSTLTTSGASAARP